MPVDPRTPVLIGCGQVNHRDEIDPETHSVEPVDLMVAAAAEAADTRVLEAVDSIRVVNVLSATYRDAGLLVGERIGASKFTTLYSPVGGNVPQTLLNQACLDIQQGRAGVVLLTGAETWRTRRGLKAKGSRLEWTPQDESVPMARVSGEDVPMAGDAEIRIKLDRPAYVYPLFEQSLRIANGESVSDHRNRVGELWARFNAVALGNPHAWIRKPATAAQICEPGPQNRMISWPYPKLMNSNNMVDQGAALILTSVEQAKRLQIPAEQWIYPHAGTDAYDTPSIAERYELHRSTAIRIAGARALELAGLDIDDVDYVDLYSCFPSAVQVAAAELGLSTDDPARPLTVTGGLTFAGGPWSNYVMHSIATVAELLVANPGRRALITANGGYLTKHSFGVYGTEPPNEFRWENTQSAVEREPTREALVQWEGVGTVEAWTTPFDRDGRPEKAFVAVRTPGGSRALAVIADPDSAQTTTREDIGGAKVAVTADGSATLQ
ncbi:acetyl-CoA acetyltransferase [Mycobacterium montefiorense]|uniref:Acetyl-CoA acetyltransferase n=1 Tax=Mycobacterium montefiorense TaxID=154654 RepID=A0AA37PKP4_9MYCO|nr:acetyl-CoA acetyltransferase [Mycobacterium montefiorense]GBG38944.1 acetyl-CoA acetyltransferase [Mycobacterium montefiorense]GKU32732.1 acetyl-CoA acetyltransferase [Mycobacterium montefiorense]GKU38254.1 acetyl-CoA acetyltransferase [Mycobacterium montefiorense]GKU47400.1 acetyl-CoA acetyltransferase [Mycobacterium montefiorense]GKU50283.1 acetyl-CoA acetyltransferase [Mycobacterium montefiorense]